jgi:hypothetical protein
VVWNVGQVPARGTATLGLMHNGASIRTAAVSINIPGGVQSTLTHSFRIDSNHTGTYAARISFALP